MPSIPLSSQAVAAVKSDLTKWFDECKSSHLSEALAYALGFNTHAALLEGVAAQGNDPLHYLVDEERLTKRLNDFGYPGLEGFFFSAQDIPEMRETLCLRSWDIEYKTKRHHAWRNLMVVTVNEALRRRLFSLRPGDNRWPSHADRNSSYPFEFILPTGDAAKAVVSHGSNDEVTVEVIVNPKRAQFLSAYYTTLKECDAVAMTWLERQEGVWLQSAMDSFRCSKPVLERLYALKVEPQGFGDKGAVR